MSPSTEIMLIAFSVQRKNARWRKTKNEDEVVDWLENNFKTVIFEPENLSIKDQLTLLG